METTVGGFNCFMRQHILKEHRIGNMGSDCTSAVYFLCIFGQFTLIMGCVFKWEMEIRSDIHSKIV